MVFPRLPAQNPSPWLRSIPFALYWLQIGAAIGLLAYFAPILPDPFLTGKDKAGNDQYTSKSSAFATLILVATLPGMMILLLVPFLMRKYYSLSFLTPDVRDRLVEWMIIPLEVIGCLPGIIILVVMAVEFKVGSTGDISYQKFTALFAVFEVLIIFSCIPAIILFSIGAINECGGMQAYRDWVKNGRQVRAQKL